MSKITESANGEDCQIRIPGVCNFDPATVCWCHANAGAAGKGFGLKSHDALGSYGCSDCHDVVDWRRRIKTFSRCEIKLMFWEGVARSFLILIKKGLVKC